MFVRRVIVQSYDYDRTGRGKKPARIRALLGIAGHPFHLAFKASPQPFFQSLLFCGQSRGRDDADSMKAESPRLSSNLCRDRGEIVALQVRLWLYAGHFNLAPV